VRRGEEVSVDHSCVEAFTVTTANQRSVHVKILSSLDPYVRYAREKGVNRLGVISIDMPGEGVDRGVEVKMFFGRTTIEVQVENMQTGETKRSAMRFETA
jgi:hypothetical protein